MHRRLPRWVWIGGGVLAFIAGTVNAIGFLGFEHQFITHLTGTTTSLGIAVAAGDHHLAERMASFIVAFVLGAALSGAIIRQTALELGLRYGLVLCIEAILLVFGIVLLDRGTLAGYLVVSGAMGLQNAMTSTYSGAVVRTTHLSGIMTGLGVMLGHWVRRLPVDTLKLTLLLTLAGGFWLGAVVGALLFRWVAFDGLLMPAVLTGATGLAYAWYCRRVTAG